MLDLHTFEVGGKSYEVIYNARARYTFEELSDYPVTQLRAFSKETHPSDREVAQLVTAGLEGARVRNLRAGVKDTRRQAWTIGEVVDVVIDDADRDEILAMFTACLHAVIASLRGAEDVEEAPDGEGKAPPTG